MRMKREYFFKKKQKRKKNGRKRTKNGHCANPPLSLIEDRKVNTNLSYDRKKNFVIWKIVILKIKIGSHSASMQLQIAMNIFNDLTMQCLHSLPNAHGRIAELICQQMICC